jgi:KipI family sensor histidine kinase inhibitor
MMRLLPYGDRAVLVEVSHPDEVLPLRDCLIEQGHAAVTALVPAARTLLVEFEPGQLTSVGLAQLIEHCESAAAPSLTSHDLVRLEVRYDGLDLFAVADEIGESTESVVRRHSGPEYTVQFCGFSPGFGYLTGLDPVLHLARLGTPRPQVDAGSVAIAAEYTGVYPRSSPGGWRLLGHTDAVLFDLDRTPPALLTPGTRVRFMAR